MATQQPAVLLDVDGTLVDTSWFHVVAWWRVFQEAKEQVTMARIHPLIGMGASDLIEKAIGRRDDDLKERHADEFDRFLDEIRAFPKAGDLLRELDKRGFQVALCTSAQKAHREPMVQAIDADDAITEIVDGDDVERAKPEPDVFAAALERLDADPRRTVVIGDTPWDIEAAKRIDVPTVAVLTGGWRREDLERAGAIAVYEDPAELLASLDDIDLLKG
jgi:HAD superfamily hydrolase (TIGR01509 family)